MRRLKHPTTVHVWIAISKRGTNLFMKNTKTSCIFGRISHIGIDSCRMNLNTLLNMQSYFFFNCSVMWWQIPHNHSIVTPLKKYHISFFYREMKSTNKITVGRLYFMKTVSQCYQTKFFQRLWKCREPLGA